MADDGERLVVLLEARIRDFEKNMQKASGTADRNYGRMGKSSRSATRQMEQDMQRSTARINQALASTSTQIGALGRTFAAGFAGGVFAGGLTGLAAGVRGIVRETAALGDEAARAGLKLKVFQEWKAVAEDTRIPLDAIVDTFKELNIRADEFATTGKGSAADAFARLGMTPEEVQRKLKDPSALMLELIQRTKALKDTAAATRIFDELFGGTGAEQAVRLLQLADGEIQNIITSAHESGRILDEEMVQRAAEIDREFNTLWRNFESGAKAAILNVSIALRDGLFNDIANMGQALRDMANDPSLHNAARFLFGEDTQIGDALAPTRGMEARVKKLSDQVANLKDLGFDATEAQRELAVARAELEAEVQRIMSGHGAGTIGSTATPSITVPPVAVKPSSGSGGGSGGSRRASRNSSSGSWAIPGLEMAGRQLKEHKATVEEVTNSYDHMGQVATTALMGIADALADGKLEGRELIQILLRVAEQMLRMPSGGSGGGFNLLSFIPKLLGFSSGTANTGGQRGQPRGIVHGQEAVIPLPSGGKVPVQVQGGASVSQAQPIVITGEIGVTVDDDGKMQAYVKKMGAQAVNVATVKSVDTVKRSLTGWQQELSRTGGFA